MTQLLMHGGTVLTQDAANPVVQSLLIEHGRVTATGTDEQVVAQARPDADRVDLRGRAVTPGFIDAHNHFSLAALARLGIDCRTPPVSSVRELLSAMSAATARTRRGQWVRGWGYNELTLAEGRHPTLSELDQIAPDNPLVIAHASAHMCVANSLALRAAGIFESSPNPPGGVIVRHHRTGRPTGVLHEVASEMVDATARDAIITSDPAAWLGAARSEARRYAALGLTCICDPCVPASVEPLYQELHGDPDFPIRILGLGIGRIGMFTAPHDRLEAAPGSTTDGFAIGGVKLFADGGEQCATCMSAPRAVRGGLRAVRNSLRHRTLTGLKLLSAPVSRLGRDGKIHSGITFYHDSELTDLLRRTVSHGMTAAVHAMGNEAIEQVLDAIAHTRRGCSDDAAFRMEHVMMAEESSMARLAHLGVAAVVQPLFVHDFGFPILLSGMHREFRILGFRDLLDAGVTVAGSSDAPVSDPAVLPAVESAVTRRTRHGDTLDRDQALSVDEALRLYTTNAARVLGLAPGHGSLQPGNAADLVVLHTDPHVVDPESIGRIRVEATYRAGRLTYERIPQP